jgi:hypothetical protein
VTPSAAATYVRAASADRHRRRVNVVIFNAVNIERSPRRVQIALLLPIDFRASLTLIDRLEPPKRQEKVNFHRLD